MNWYKKIIFSQTYNRIINYLSSLGTSKDIIEFILSLPPQNIQLYINEVRKNPSITLDQIKSINLNNEIKDPYLPQEKNAVQRYADGFPQFGKWILTNLRKIRMGLPIEKLNNQTFFEYTSLLNKLPEIRDWVRNANPDIASYSLSQAINMSDEWHKAVAGEGSGLMYEPTKPQNIVYGPTWKNPELNGWTIQKVVTKNDLEVEGNKMNHCVGSYCHEVISGSSQIYSLRDPDNEPHITLEITGNNNSQYKDQNGKIIQIQGNSNSEPEDKYKKFIKEWMSNGAEQLGIQREINTFEDLEEKNPYSAIEISDINDSITKILQSEENDLGLKYVYDGDLISIAEDVIGTAEAMNSRKNRESYYFGDITNTAGLLVKLAIFADRKLKKWPQTSKEYDSLILKENEEKNIEFNELNKLEEYAIHIIDESHEEISEYSYDIGEEYPSEENYESAEEYKKAIEQYEEAESNIFTDWIKKTVKGGFAYDVLDNIAYFRRRKIIPNIKTNFIKASNKNWFKKAQKNMWDKNSALQYLNSIYPILEKAGYSAKIIGSVATKGFSNKDLDILLTPKDNFDFEIIMENIQGDFSINQETYYTALPDGRIVDFFFNQE